MDWLSQNWLWVAVGIGAAYYLLRGRLGGRAGGGHAGHRDPSDAPAAANPPEAAVDPVSGEAVRTEQALTSLYQEKIYYFASKENRDRFEAAPQEYAPKAVGHPVAATREQRPRRRGGCC